MLNAPVILIQLVHIEGTRKGEINETDNPIVTFGRHPDCDVRFPNVSRSVSRKHAEIKREGNRFLFFNHSQNGSYVNGKLTEQAYLAQGDVITFSKSGPKVSFLYKIHKTPTHPVILKTATRKIKHNGLQKSSLKDMFKSYY